MNVHELLCIFNSEIVAMRNLNAAGKKKVPNAPAIEQELPRPEAPGPSGAPAPQPIEGTPVPAQIGNSYKVKAASCFDVGAAIIKETQAAAQACPTTSSRLLDNVKEHLDRSPQRMQQRC